LITKDHVNNLLLVFATQSSEQDNDWDIFSDLWDGGINLASSVLLLDIDLELKCGLVALFILRSYLSIPRILRSGELDVENQDNVAGLSFLGDYNFFRAIDYEVTTLIIHTLSISNDTLVVAVTQVALTGPDHDGYPSQVNLACLIFHD